MGVIVDFGGDLDHMLDELEETYDGRILSPQGKVIRVMPEVVRREEEDGLWLLHGHVYVTTMFDEQIYQALLQTVPMVSQRGLEESEREVREELARVTAEVERKVTERGFIIRRGRYHFSAEDKAPGKQGR